MSGMSLLRFKLQISFTCPKKSSSLSVRFRESVSPQENVTCLPEYITTGHADLFEFCNIQRCF